MIIIQSSRLVGDQKRRVIICCQNQVTIEKTYRKTQQNLTDQN